MYWVWSGIFHYSEGDTEHYDWLDKKLQFNVQNNQAEVGTIHFLTEWHA